VLILDFYRNAPETWWLPLISTASLRFLPRVLRCRLRQDQLRHHRLWHLAYEPR
jgi:hypothetical protein